MEPSNGRNGPILDIDKTYKLTDIRQAHDYVATGHAVGKVIMEIK